MGFRSIIIVVGGVNVRIKIAYLPARCAFTPRKRKTLFLGGPSGPKKHVKRPNIQTKPPDSKRLEDLNFKNRFYFVSRSCLVSIGPIFDIRKIECVISYTK